MFHAILFSGLFFSLTSSADASVSTDCRSAKEFIASAEFLKKEKVFPPQSKSLQDIVFEITKGCAGAAQRFKDVFKTLDKAGFPRNKTIETALEFSKRSDAQTKAFCLSFQKAFLKKYLDMTPADSFALAKSLSGGVDDSHSVSAEDFERMVAFCVDNKTGALPRKYCADQSLKLAQISGQYKERLFSDFKDLYFWFLKHLEGEVPAPKAIDWALKIVSGGPEAKENFIRSFEYLENSSDFPLKRPEQIRLAFEVSQISHQIKQLPHHQ